MTKRWTWIGIGVVAIATVIVAGIVLGQIGAPKTVAGAMKVGPQRCTDSDPSEKEECARLTTFARQLLDQAPHAPVASVEVYEEPPSNVLHTVSGYADFAIVSFKLSDEPNQAFYVRCGVGIAKNLCFDLRPLKPGEWTVDDAMTNPNPVVVP